MSEPIRVFVVEDEPHQLRAVEKLLGLHAGVCLAGAALSAEIAQSELLTTPCDVVLMDLELPGASGLQATRAVKALVDPPEVLVLTSADDDEQVFEAMRAGASGYVVKGLSGDKLLAAIVEVDAGGTVIEPRLARRFWAYFKGVQEPVKPGPVLTELEHELLFVIAKGLSNAEAGRIVSLDRRTVRTHLGHIYEKLGVRTHVEAVVAALRLGLIQL